MIGIKDMEMPKSCDICDFNTFGQYCDFPRYGMDVNEYIESRHKDCPLIEIEDKEKLDVD